MAKQKFPPGCDLGNVVRSARPSAALTLGMNILAYRDALRLRKSKVSLSLSGIDRQSSSIGNTLLSTMDWLVAQTRSLYIARILSVPSTNAVVGLAGKRIQKHSYGNKHRPVASKHSVSSVFRGYEISPRLPLYRLATISG